MSGAVVFQGINALDFAAIRTNVVRIPEVSRRVLEAQESWDRCDANSLDLFNFIASEDKIFLSNIKLKSLASSIVQVGLFDRYIRYYPRPRWFVGNSNGDSALLVVLGKISFREMVINSQAARGNHSLAPLSYSLAPELMPLLSGISLTQYSTFVEFKDGDDEWLSEEVVVDKIDLGKIINHLIIDHGVKRFVNLGPGNLLYPHLEEDLRFADIQVIDSIDMDPMLSWFWQGLRRRELALAQ